MTRRTALVTAMAAVVCAWSLLASGPADFKPTVTFSGTSLTGWHALGAPAWKAENGEYVGSATAGGGWLVP